MPEIGESIATLAHPRRGLGFPVDRSLGGYFRSRSTEDTAWSNVANAVLTAQGSRAMARSFGSGLHRLLFERDDIEEMKTAIDREVRTAVERWVPTVIVRDVIVAQATEKSVQIQVVFSLVQDRYRTI